MRVVPQHPAEMAARMEVGRGSWVQLRAVEGQTWDGGGELGMPSVLGDLLPPSSPTPPWAPSPTFLCSLQQAMPSGFPIAFFHPGAFL